MKNHFSGMIPTFSLITLTIVPTALIAETPPANTVEQLSMESQNEEGPLKRQEVEIIKVTATVKDIDQKERTASLILPNDKEIDLKVSDEVKRLAEIKPGDQVIVKYLASLAYEVRKPTAAEIENPKETVVETMKNPSSLPPGAAGAVVTRSMVEITDIDMDNEMVQIKLPDGKLFSMKARVPENLKRIEVGDKVAVTYAEAVAVSIEPLKGTS